MGKAKRRGFSAVEGCSSALTPIIPGLPNEVAVTILARLPRALHGNFRRVCRAWRDALQPSAVNTLRNTLHISELWILFVFWDNSIALYDPRLGCLSFPIPYFHNIDCQLVVLGSIGSLVFFREDPLDPDLLDSIDMDFDHTEYLRTDILCFDTASMQWQSDSIPLWNNAPLYGFTSAVLDSHLCVAGGAVDGGRFDVNRVGVRKVGRFDVNSRRWEMMPEMHEKRVGAAAVVLQGRLLVINGHYNTYKPNRYQVEVLSGEIWDPTSREWTLEPNLMPTQLFPCLWQQDVAVVMDTLYAIRSYYDDVDFEIFRYESASKIWTSLGQLPPIEYCSSCGKDGRSSRLVGAGKELWVVLNCDNENATCTATILSCVPTTGSPPLLWSSVPITSSVKFPPGYAVVHGNVRV